MAKIATISQGEVSKAAGVTRKTVLDWTKKGFLGTPTKEGRALKYSEKEVQKFIKTRAKGATSNA